MSLTGVFCVIVTPFQSDESIDYDALRANVNWYINKGVHGLIACGSTGEFASLTPDERRHVLEQTLRASDGRVPVLAGTTADSTRQVIANHNHALTVGAAGAMLLPSPYFHPSQAEILYHVQTIADTVRLPIMLYNNPGTTGVDMELDTVLQLAKLEMVTYIKESTGDIQRVRDIVIQGQDEIQVFCGWESLALESLFLGAVGWVCVAANFVPELCCDLYKAVRVDKDYEQARLLYGKLLPLLQYLETSGKLVQVTKYAMHIRGLTGGAVRQPRLPLTPAEQNKVEHMLDDSGYSQ